MKRAWIRSSIFNVLFILVNLICCIVLLPTLLLPRRYYLIGIELYHFIIVTLEYLVLGLKYEVRGEEYLPEHGSYLVAAKHMSTYETFKLRLLFNDPAIILKKELLRIPLWGAYLKKSDVIAIDRSTPDKAIESIRKGALHMKEIGRPIVIFPQGTRVKPDTTPAEKPYKSGIYRVQKTTGLPIIPMATNSGLFWPKIGWFKSPGTVVFKFMPPIPPGRGKEEVMDTIQIQLETESLSLMNEAKMNAAASASPLKTLAAFLFLLIAGAGLYSYVWFQTAEATRESYITFMSDVKRAATVNEPQISGFPGPIRLDVLTETIETNAYTADIKIIQAQVWPLPFMPVKMQTGPIAITTEDWSAPIDIQSTAAAFTFGRDRVVNIKEGIIRQENFEALLAGTVDLKQRPIPKLDLVLGLKNHADLLASLAEKGIIEDRIAMFLSFGFSQLGAADGIVRVPLYQQDNRLFAGPLPIADLPAVFEQEESLGELHPLEPYNQLGPAQ